MCRVISHAGALHLSAGAYEPSGATCDARSVAPAGSSSDSSDSYNRDDAWCFLHERNEVWDLYFDATHEIGRLEFCLNASKTALATAEGETNAA